MGKMFHYGLLHQVYLNLAVKTWNTKVNINIYFFSFHKTVMLLNGLCCLVVQGG